MLPRRFTVPGTQERAKSVGQVMSQCMWESKGLTHLGNVVGIEAATARLACLSLVHPQINVVGHGWSGSSTPDKSNLTTVVSFEVQRSCMSWLTISRASNYHSGHLGTDTRPGLRYPKVTTFDLPTESVLGTCILSVVSRHMIVEFPYGVV